MLYYCGKSNCQGHRLFSEQCGHQHVAPVEAKPVSSVSRYKPSRRFHDQFDIPEAKTNERKPALAVTG